MSKNKYYLLLLTCFLVGCNNDVSSSEISSSSDSVSISEESVSTSEVMSSSLSEESEISESSIDSSSISVSSSEEETGGVVYCSANAKLATAKGTREDPLPLQYAINYSLKGSTIIMLDGTYKYSVPIDFNSAVEKHPATNKEEGKTLKAENDGMVKIDFSAMEYLSTNRGFKLNSNYWTIKGIEVFGAGDNGIYIGGSYNTIDHCVTHDNSDTGLQLGRSSSECNSIDTWPSYNLIKNCTSYDNHDPKGEDSDGFACKLTTGVGNVFDGCIAYNNVDDGWDLYTKGDTGAIGPVKLINCVAFNNGVTTGQNTDGVPYGTSNSDGNGFKLGGELISVQHQVINCVAFNNLACGFTDNSNPGCIWIENCTSYNNGVRDNDASNIDMCRSEETSNNYYKGILSYSDSNVDFRTNKTKLFNSKDQYKGTASYCVFYYGRTLLKFADVEECNYLSNSLRGEIITPTNKPFVSTTIPDSLANIHNLLRDENGNVKLGDFLKVTDEYVNEVYGTSVSIGANLA